MTLPGCLQVGSFAFKSFEVIADHVIYFLVSGDEVVYVGQSENIHARMPSHVAKRNNGKMNFDRVYYFSVPPEDSKIVEAAWIRDLQPVYNLAHTDHTRDQPLRDRRPIAREIQGLLIGRLAP